MYKIAVSQRVVENTTYPERRDALDQRWTQFLWSLGAVPVLLPNMLPDVNQWFAELSIEGLLLTSGNDLSDLAGSSDTAPERDAIEEAALCYCEQNSLPALGVCRGMQLILRLAGAALEETPGHVATRHQLTDPARPGPTTKKRIGCPEQIACHKNNKLFVSRTGEKQFAREVNSYHRYGVYKHSLPPCFNILATSPDGVVEAVCHQDKRLLAVMWHPEREETFQEEDAHLFAEHFRPC